MHQARYDGVMHHYFRQPFPSRKAFGPYASPGPVVHLPVMFVCVTLGWVLCRSALSDVLVLGVIGGCALYLGRDLAIRAHYNVLITIGVFAALLVMLSVGVPVLRAIHHWATQCSYSWPAWVYALGLVVCLGMQVKRDKRIARHTDG